MRTFYSLLPARGGVCLIEGEEHAQPYLVRTADIRRRIQRLLSPPEAQSKKLNLREFARRVRYRETGSAFEQSLVYYRVAKKYFPKRYAAMTRLRPPAVLKINLRNAYPRCFVTRRIAVDEMGRAAVGASYGPFRSRKMAESLAEKWLDFHKVRRCQIKIRRDPEFPGCIYSEMKMCLAPCFGGCTKEEYDQEVGRLVAFLDSGGGSLRTQLENERNRASEELDFERASLIHKKLEKLDDALRGSPELARKIDELDAVVLQRSLQENTVLLFAVRGGWLAEPTELRFDETSEPRSAEGRIREYLEGPQNTQHARGTPRQNSVELSEHLALIGKWFYSQPRDGEIFFREKDWPYRKILRGCSRVLHPKQEPAAASPPDEKK